MKEPNGLVARLAGLVGITGGRAGDGHPFPAAQPGAASLARLAPCPAGETPAGELLAGEMLARGLQREAWIDYAETGGAPVPRHVTLRRLHGRRGADGGAEIASLVAWCHERQAELVLRADGIRALRASPHGPALTRAEDIGFWLRAEGGLLHERDTLRLWELRRRAREEAEAAHRRALASGARVELLPFPVRVESQHPDRPEARRAEEAVLIAYDLDPAGKPRQIFVAPHGEARRGRPIALQAGTPGMRLTRLEAPPGGPPVADVAAWLPGLARRG